jgi:sugar O-acyltransferase (sialic acid O-acetyltransferase NeuD family)
MQKKKKLVIFGLGMLGELAHFYFTHDSDYEVVAFTADTNFPDSGSYLNLPFIPFDEVSQQFPPADYHLFIAIGYSKLNAIRISKYTLAKEKGYTLASYVSSKSSSWPQSIDIGENVFIMENNVIMPFCKIEDNVLIWVGNILSHHSVIKKHTTITSHAAIGGNVIIEEGCFIGLNATIRDSIKLAEGTVVATGANVTKDTEAHNVYMGSPAVIKMESSKAKI